MDIRWKFVKDKAIETLEKYGVNFFPFDLIKLVSKFQNVKLLSYSDMSALLNSKGMSTDCEWVKDNLADGSNDAAVIKMNNNAGRIIIYNDDNTQNINKRIRFSIAHEIAHIVLEHPFVTCISRNGYIEKHNYKAYEAEANTFAQCLLLPPPMITNEDTIESLSQKFDISKEVAKRSLNVFNNQRYWGWPTKKKLNFSLQPPRKYQTLKNNYVPLWFNGFLAYCKKCHALSLLRTNGKYCSHCNSQNIDIFPVNEDFILNERFGYNIMIYENYESDQNGKLLKCIRCDNEELDSDQNFCSICGAPLRNTCSGVLSENVAYPFSPPEQSCKAVLAPNARFCHICGSKSIFYCAKILENKFNLPISDDDLPF